MPLLDGISSLLFPSFSLMQGGLLMSVLIFGLYLSFVEVQHSNAVLTLFI